MIVDGNLSHLIVSLYEKWEARSASNNPSKLAKLMDATCQSVRNMISGSVKKPGFYLFDKFVRAVGVESEDYLKIINSHYPEAIQVAKRVVNSTFNETNSDKENWMLDETLALDIFQRVIAGEPLTMNQITLEYGKKGSDLVTRMIETEEILKDQDGNLSSLGKEGENQLVGEFGLKIIQYNTNNFSVSKAGEDGVRALGRQFYASAELINKVRSDLDEYFQKIWAEVKKENQEKKQVDCKTYAINLTMAPIE